MKLSSSETLLLQAIAFKLGVNQDDLYKLINFESKWNPKAANPVSSAKGLIQFTNATAQDLGFKDSAELIRKNPTITDQLPIVEKYLTQFKPFTGKQSLYLSVFYPKARKWPENKMFSERVRKVNPGVNTPGDYIRKIEGFTKQVALSTMALAIAGAGFFFTFS